MKDYITLSEDTLLSMDDITGDISLPLECIPYDVRSGDTLRIHFEEDSDKIIHEYTVISIINDAIVDLEWNRQIEENLLESPQVKLDTDDVLDPQGVDFKQKIKTAQEREEAEKQQQELEAEQDALKEKYSNLISDIENQDFLSMPVKDSIERMFDALVPPSGLSDTKAGELVRAVYRILARDYNDGDKFFEGYGIETCASFAEYLFDNGFSEEIQDIIDDAYRLSDDDDKYTAAIMNLAKTVVTTIVESPSLIWTPNKEDSLEHSNSYIVENQPRYEFEILGSDDIVKLVEMDVLTSWDLINYIENVISYESIYEGATVATPWGHHDTSVTVENLTRDAYDYLQDSVRRHLDGWWEGLVAEHKDELPEEED